MKGFCIGVGKEWSEAARVVAARMSQMTGVECDVIDKCPNHIAHPSWMKMELIRMNPEVDSFFVFDADILPMKPWRPKTLFEELGRPFCAVYDRNWAATQKECTKFNLPWPDCYVNGGLLIFGKEHDNVWEYVRHKHPRYGSWLEQTALNEALIKTGVECCRLPRRFNRIHSGSSPIHKTTAINLHLAGMHNPQMIIDVISKLNDPHEPYDFELPSKRNEDRPVAEIAQG